MEKKLTVRKYRTTTKYELEEYTEEKYVWWCKFLRWLFEDEFKEFIEGLKLSLERRVEQEIAVEMRKYKARLDGEILKKIEIAKPAFEVTSDLDEVSVAPEPVLIGHRKYPKRLVSKKDS